MTVFSKLFTTLLHFIYSLRMCWLIKHLERKRVVEEEDKANKIQPNQSHRGSLSRHLQSFTIATILSNRTISVQILVAHSNRLSRFHIKADDCNYYIANVCVFANLMTGNYRTIYVTIESRLTSRYFLVNQQLQNDNTLIHTMKNKMCRIFHYKLVILFSFQIRYLIQWND